MESRWGCCLSGSFKWKLLHPSMVLDMISRRAFRGSPPRVWAGSCLHGFPPWRSFTIFPKSRHHGYAIPQKPVTSLGPLAPPTGPSVMANFSTESSPPPLALSITLASWGCFLRVLRRPVMT